MTYKDYLIEATITNSLDASPFRLKSQAITSYRSYWNNLTTLTSLNFSDNKLGFEGLQSLLPYMNKMTGLTSLDLSKNKLGPAGISALSDNVRNLTALTSLNVSYNDCSLENINVLVDNVCNMTTLLSLTICGNDISVPSTRIFFSLLAKMTCLTSLNVGGNGFGIEGVKALSPYLGYMRSLESFNIGGNRLGVQGITILAPNLNNMQALTSFGLSNSLDEQGTIALVANTDKLTSLTSLNISYNCIGAHGIVAIAPCLTRLTALNLRRNRFGKDGITAFAQQLTNLYGLTLLDLSGSFIDNDGITILAPQLPHLIKLRSLDISDNYFVDEKAMTVLSPNLAKMTALTSLNIEKNRIYDSAIIEFKMHMVNMIELRFLKHDCYRERHLLNAILKRNRAIHLKISNLVQKIDSLNNNKCIQQENVDVISEEIDELETFSIEIERLHNVEPFALINVQSKLRCRLALVCNDFAASIIYASSMRSFPQEELLPYAHSDPKLLVYVFRAFTTALDDHYKMRLLCEWLINTNLIDITINTQAELYRLILMLARFADPHGANQSLNSSLQILDLFPNQLKRRSASSNANLCRLLSYDQLIFNIKCCYREECSRDENSLLTKSLLDLINVSRPYTVEKEKQLLDHSLVNIYFKLSKPIITYERLICESYPHNLVPEHIEDLLPEVRKRLLSIADLHEKNNAAEIGIAVNNNHHSVPSTQGFFSRVNADSCVSSEANPSADHSNSF